MRSAQLDGPAGSERPAMRSLPSAANLIVGRAAYEAALRLYPQDGIDYRLWGGG